MGRPRLWLPRRRLRWRRRRDMILDALLLCAAPPQLVVVEGPEPGPAEAAVEALLSPLQPLREQFTAVTGLGLESDEEEAPVPLRRAILPAAEGGPAISHLLSGDPRGQPVLFIHGSPGVAEEWARFLVDPPPGQRRIAVDRPGFGETRPEGAMTELSKQAAALAPLLGADRPEGAVVVGYSYGGPVALRLAADYPEAIGAVLLIGSAADPAQEEIHPLQRVAALEMFSELLPDELAHSNAELMALQPELEALGRDLARIDAPVTIVHGLQDTLVPPENVAYLNARLPADSPTRVILVEEADHFLPWSHVGLLEQALDCAVADSRRRQAGGGAPGGGASGKEVSGDGASGDATSGGVSSSAPE